MDIGKFKTNVTSYNRMFFDENYDRSSRLQNQTFWKVMDKFRNKYPDVQIQRVIVTHLGAFYEDVELINAPTNIQNEFEQIHHQYYYAIRLKLYPEFEGRNDILQELSRTFE